MKVGQLIKYLQDLDPKMEVRLMTQPNYPLQYAIVGVVTDADIEEKGEEPTVVYLLEGCQQGYGNRDAWGLV